MGIQPALQAINVAEQPDEVLCAYASFLVTDPCSAVAGSCLSGLDTK